MRCEMLAVICLDTHSAFDTARPLDPVRLAAGLMKVRMARPYGYIQFSNPLRVTRIEASAKACVRRLKSTTRNGTT